MLTVNNTNYITRNSKYLITELYYLAFIVTIVTHVSLIKALQFLVFIQHD